MKNRSKTGALNQAALVERLPIAYGYLAATIARSFAVSLVVRRNGKVTRVEPGEAWNKAATAALAGSAFPIDMEAVARESVFGTAKFRMRARVADDMSITCSTVGWQDEYRRRSRQLALPETRVFTSLDAALTWMSDASDIYLATASAPIDLE